MKIRKTISYLITTLMILSLVMVNQGVTVKAEIEEGLLISHKKLDFSDEGQVLNIHVWNDEFPRRMEYYPGYVPNDTEDALKGGMIGDIKVNFIETYTGYNMYQNKLDELLPANSTVSSNNKIDMFMVESDYALKYVNSDNTIALSDLGITEDELSGQYQYTKDLVTDTNGDIKGATWQICPGVMIYNREAAKEVLGSDNPEKVQTYVSDWDKYNSTSKVMKDAGYKMTATVNDTYRVFADNTTSLWRDKGVWHVDDNITRWAQIMKEQVNNKATGVDDLWSTAWSNGFYPDGKVFCYFAPEWVIDYCMAADDDASIAANGGWGACEGPQGFSWGGTWLCVANGTDNQKLVADIIRNLTTNEGIMKSIAKGTGDQVNNINVMNELANDDSIGNSILGGQNAMSIFSTNAKSFRKNNITEYDQECAEVFQSTMSDYFDGYPDTYNEAVELFKNRIKKRYEPDDYIPEDIIATSVKLDKKEITMTAGDRDFLNATVFPRAANDSTIIWSSSNENVAVVDEYGCITAQFTIGTATITASNVESGLSATCTVTVKGGTDGLTEDGFEYRYIKDGSEITIIGYVGTETEIEFPEEIDGVKVTMLGDEEASYSDSYPSDLKRVVIPEGIIIIGTNVFSGLSNLSDIEIPSSVNRICDGAFWGTKWLNTLKENSDMVIVNDLLICGSGCEGAVVIPDSVRVICDYAFRIDSEEETCNIITVTIPEGVTSIGERAFEDNYSIVSISIPESVTDIGEGALVWCGGLKYICVSENSYADNWLKENYNGEAAIIYGESPIKDKNGFLYDSGKDEIEIMSYTGTDIEVSIPKEIDNKRVATLANCFSNNKDVISVSIPESVTSIENAIFRGCDNLSSILIDKNNPQYEDGNCNAVIEKNTHCLIAGCKNTTIANSVKTIGGRAFQDCSGLVAMTIPEGVTDIGEYAFFESGLTGISIPKSMIKIGECAFCQSKNMETIELKNSSTQIGRAAFFGTKWYTDRSTESEWVILNTVLVGCSDELEGTITVPDGVTQICGGLFDCCDKIENIIIPESVTMIGDSAFRECEALENISIPNVAYIGEGAFEYCRKLKTVQLSDDLSVIEPFTFSGCRNLITVNLPDGLRKIGKAAFQSCGVLEQINIPSTVSVIEDWAFNNCIILNSITIPSGIVSIGEYTFRNCKDIKNIIIPNGVTSIGEKAFANCIGLESVIIPNSVTSIDETAFESCLDTMIIKAYKDSYAEKFAKEKGFEVCYINDNESKYTVTLEKSKYELDFSECDYGNQQQIIINIAPMLEGTENYDSIYYYKNKKGYKWGYNIFDLSISSLCCSAGYFQNDKEANITKLILEVYPSYQDDPDSNNIGSDVLNVWVTLDEDTERLVNINVPIKITDKNNTLQKWENTYTITYNANGGYLSTYTDEENNITYYDKETYKIPAGEAIRYNYIEPNTLENKVFTGWKTDGDTILYKEYTDDLKNGEKYIGDYIPTGDVTFVAQWIEDTGTNEDVNGSKQDDLSEQKEDASKDKDEKPTETDVNAQENQSQKQKKLQPSVGEDTTTDKTTNANITTVSELSVNTDNAATLETSKVGEVVVDKKVEYLITEKTEKLVKVTYQKPKDYKKSSYTIPDTITLANGVVAQVTEVAPNAFQKCTKLKKAVLGKNITKVGKNAFKGCKSLKTIVVKSTKMTNKSFGKNAFKGISKNATFKCPKKQLKNYKKWIKKAGAPKTAKYKKQ